MSQERSARVGSAVLVRMSRSLLLTAALACLTVLAPAGRAGAPRPDAGLIRSPLRATGLIAFEADGEIYVADANGGTATKIVGSKAEVGEVVNMQPALSPDGTRVAFSSRREDGKFSIYVVGVDGLGMRRLTDGLGDDSEPAWSPDGSQILFAGGHKGEDVELYLIASDGTGSWLQLTFDQRQETSPSWSNGTVR
jgi:Tol biopolymer transport system component